MTRERDHLKDCDESFLFFIVTGGRVQMTHNGREAVHMPGDAGLIHNSRPGVGFWPEGGSTIAVRVDGTALRALVRHPEAMAGSFIERARPGLALLNGYVRSFSEVKDSLTPSLAHSFGHHVVDLVAAVLGPTRDGAAQAEEGGVRAARLSQILDAISRRACDPRFTVETVAGELGVTSRYIQRILEPTGSTFSEHVTEQRLRRARRLLCSGNSRSKVAEIALEAGFNDLAHFHRVFRRRFGATPAAMRGATAVA
jgi:AraC-like DNA-binding protein